MSFIGVGARRKIRRADFHRPIQKRQIWRCFWDGENRRGVNFFLLLPKQAICYLNIYSKTRLNPKYGGLICSRSYLAPQTMLSKTHTNFWCAFLTTRFEVPNTNWWKFGPHIMGAGLNFYIRNMSKHIYWCLRIQKLVSRQFLGRWRNTKFRHYFSKN